MRRAQGTLFRQPRWPHTKDGRGWAGGFWRVGEGGSQGHRRTPPLGRVVPQPPARGPRGALHSDVFRPPAGPSLRAELWAGPLPRPAARLDTAELL